MFLASLCLSTPHRSLNCSVQASEKRPTLNSIFEAQLFVQNRIRQFLNAIEAGYRLFPGTLFCGDSPTMVDFQLLGCILTLNFMFGDTLVGPVLAETPSLTAALAVLSARPKIKSFVESNFNGEIVMPSELCVKALVVKVSFMFYKLQLILFQDAKTHVVDTLLEGVYC